MEIFIGLVVRCGFGLYVWLVIEGVQCLGFGGELLGGEESCDLVVVLCLIKYDQQVNFYVFCDLYFFFGDSLILVCLFKEIVMVEGNY